MNVPARAVKYRAFMPRNGETSVFDVAGLPVPSVWQRGHEVGRASGRSLCGMGEVTYGGVQSVGLRVQNAEPPPRHANIVDWPPEKDAQKVIAMDLAASAVLCLEADPNPVSARSNASRRPRRL